MKNTRQSTEVFGVKANANARTSHLLHNINRPNNNDDINIYQFIYMSASLSMSHVIENAGESIALDLKPIWERVRRRQFPLLVLP